LSRVEDQIKVHLSKQVMLKGFLIYCETVGQWMCISTVLNLSTWWRWLVHIMSQGHSVLLGKAPLLATE